MTSPPEKSRAVPAIATGGLIVGILDITSAFITWWCRGVGPVRGLQGIAAGLLGSQSFQGGVVTAGLGLTIHFFVAFMVVTVFYVGEPHVLVSNAIRGCFRLALWHGGLPLHVLVRSAVRISQIPPLHF